MNKQPFYHGVSILFTATTFLSEKQIMECLRIGFKQYEDDVLMDSIEIESMDAEPGDPADLL